MASKSAYITIRVSQDTKDLIAAMAQGEERTVSNVAARLLKAGLLANGIKLGGAARRQQKESGK